MKNRFYFLRLITTFLGLSLLLFSVVSLAGEPGNPDFRKFAGSHWESIRANQNTGKVNPQDVIKARNQADMLRVKSSSSSMGLNWQSVGPDNFPGMIWSTIFDNTDPSGLTLIAGSAGGGIWKSINLGLTWTQMAVENNVIPKVSSLVQTSDGTIYAATGVTTCKAINYKGNGIYRSTSSGQFTVIPGTQGNADFDAVAKLAINVQTGRIFAATVGGIYYSDNGNDWIKAISGYAMDVVVGPDGIVLMAVGDSAYIAPSSNPDIKVTLTTGKENALPNSGIGWMVFAIAPSNANVMYASLASTDGKLLNVYTSTDRGLTWSIVFPNNTLFEPYNGTGCYSNTLAVFPNDPDKIFLGGVNMWYGQKVLATGFYNWEQVSFGSYGALSEFFAPNFHHSYMFRPNNPNQLVMATDGGVSVATIGSSAVTFQTSNKDLQTGQFNSVSFSAQKGYVMGGGDRIGTQVLGYFCPTTVSFPSNGYQVWRTDASSLPDNYQPQPSSFCGNGGTCEWSSVDSKVAVYTRANTYKVRRQDFTDINYDNDFYLHGTNLTSSAHIPMRLWETFNQGDHFGVTVDSVKVHADQKAFPPDTILMVPSASNKFLFPYTTTDSIPKGDSIMVADPIAGRFFIYGDSLYSGVTGRVKGIFMTKDMLKMTKTPEFFLIFKDAIFDDPITALAIDANLSTLWAGTSKGRLIRITGFTAWDDSARCNVTSSQYALTDTLFTNTPFAGRYVTSISMNPHNVDQVLVTLGNYGNQDYVYYSKNGHEPAPLFTSIQSNLPMAPVYSGLLLMNGNDNAVLGTDLGIYTTTNVNSATPVWAPDMQNLGDVPVTEVRQQVMDDYHILNRGVIYLSSYGRGLWLDTTYRYPVGIEPVHGKIIIKGELNLNPNPVKDVLYVSYTNEHSGSLSLSVYDLTGRLLMNTSFGEQPKGLFSTTINLNSLSHGTYIVKVGNGYGKIVKL
jgi:hypothetical protein